MDADDETLFGRPAHEIRSAIEQRIDELRLQGKARGPEDRDKVEHAVALAREYEAAGNFRAALELLTGAAWPE